MTMILHRILGFHIIGPYAPVLIQEVVNAMTSGGSIEEINQTFIIDLDGTLVQTEKLKALSYTVAVQHLLGVGGGVIQSLLEYVSMVERIVRQHALEAARDGLHIVAAALGDKVKAIGAVALALHTFQKD